MSTPIWTSPLHRIGIAWPELFKKDLSLVGLRLKGVVPRQFFLTLLVAAGYYAGSRIGFLLTPHQTPIATFWPSNAIVLAAFLLAPYSRWWIFLLAIFPVHLLIQLSTGIPLATASGWFLSNSAEALLGAVCIRRFKKTEELFESVNGVLIFLSFAAALAPLASSFADAAVVLTTGFGKGYWELWMSRLFSNMLAAVTVAPTIVVIAQNAGQWKQRLNRWRVLEAVFLATGIVVLSSFVFSIKNPTIPALTFSPLPLVVWIVVRFGADGLYPSLLAMTVISTWNATHGRDPFVFAPIAEGILALQIFLCTIALPMMLLAALLAERKSVEQSLRESRGRLINAQEQERRRIARELHDDIGQQLAILQIEIEQLKIQAGEELRPSLEKLHEQTSATSASTRTLSHGLHSVHLEILGLVPALNNLCRTMSQETSIPVEFTDLDTPANLDPQISLCLYRVTQEALHNVARHSHAHKAAVELHRHNSWISLRVVDDGIGIHGNCQARSGLGLASMRERVCFVGGTFKIDSGQMQGTTIEANVPLTPASS
jgi:two-component system sensor histidine kinase UhpB